MVPDLVFPDERRITDEHDRDTGISRGILVVHLNEPLLVAGIMVDFQGFEVELRIPLLKICNNGFQMFAVLAPVAIKIDSADGDVRRSKV